MRLDAATDQRRTAIVAGAVGNVIEWYSVVFGWLGDTIGRSRTLLISVAMMAIPTLVLGLLPTYASIGIAAPALLVLVRRGGELSTSVTYLVETRAA